jgi:hypothetical protein
MLDVHPPHNPIGAWKEYLLHMSTIVLGLLIAIGLEQSVEAVHRARERSDLRESLQRETQKAIVDAGSSEKTQGPPLRRLVVWQLLVKDALIAHRRLTAPLPEAADVKSTVPIDPAWSAAKSSGELSLLTQQEVQIYSEAERLFAGAQQAHDAGIAASLKSRAFAYRYGDPNNLGSVDLSSAAPADLDHFLDLLIDEANAWSQYRVMCQFLRGAETAILAGERDLGQVQKAELQFYSRTF